MIIIPDYILNILVLICLYYMLALCFNLCAGYTGLPLFSLIGFYAIGAYGSAIAYLNGIPYIVSMLLGALFTAFCGFLLSFPSLKLRGTYFTITTLGFAEIIRLVINNEIWLTGGPLGLSPQTPVIFGIRIGGVSSNLIEVFVFTAITFVAIQRLVKSPYGRVLKSIREDDLAASTLGKNTWKYKSQVLTIAAFFSGLAGCMWAHYIMFLIADQFSLSQLTTIVAGTVLGGMASNLGSLVGVGIMVILPEFFRFLGLPSYQVYVARQMLVGVILILIMLKKPEGLFGEVSPYAKAISRRRKRNTKG